MKLDNFGVTFFEETCAGGKNICTVDPFHLEMTDVNEAYPYLKQASVEEQLFFCFISLSIVLPGMVLRGFIFGFLLLPSETSTLINTEIFLQQFCRFCGVAYFLWFALANISPFSLEDAFGDNFCN